MTHPGQPGDRKAIWLLSGLGGILGGLCCLPPIVAVLLGLAGISAANSLGNTLYGEYRWYFRLFALACVGGGLVIHFRRRGICTLDEARRQRQRLINVSLLAVFTAIGIYILWTYVILHYWGIAAGLPWAQYDESWAIPTSAVLLSLAVLALFWYQRAQRAKAYTERPTHGSGRQTASPSGRPPSAPSGSPGQTD